MKQIKLKKYLIGALSFVFAFVLGLGVWTGFGLHAKEANAAGETYTLKFVDTGYIETLTSVNVNGNGTGSLVEGEAISGKAVKVVANDTSAYPYFRIFDGNTVTAGETYHIRLKIKGDGTKFHLWQNLATYELIDDWVATTSEWVEYSYDYTVKNTATENVMLFCQVVSVPEGGGCFYIEDLSVEKTVSVTNGSAIGALPSLEAGKAWVVDGKVITTDTVYNYTENKTAVAAYANTLTLTQSEEITEKVGEFAKVHNATTAELTTTGAYNGKAISLVRTDGTAGENASFSMTFNGVSVTAGETYTVRFKLKTAGSIHIYHIADGNLYSWGKIQLIDDWVAGSAGAWLDCSYTYTSAYTQENLILGFQLTSNANSVSALIDELYVESPTKMTVSQGSPIGTLPALEEGKAWTIDGEVITENTIWNYSEDKTAVVKTAYTITFKKT